MSSTTKHRILLTGASGALGRNVLELVRDHADFQVLALLRHESRELAASSNLETLRVDNFERPHVGALIGRFQPTAIVHCAATGMHFPRAQWFELVRFNVDLTIDLCECAAALGDCHFVFVSTGLVYREQACALSEDQPLDTLHPYGASKAAADLLVRSAAAEFKVPLTVLRPFSFTGRWEDRSRLFSSLLRAAADRVPLPLTSGTQVRDHCSVRDVARGIVMAIEARHHDGTTARVLNLGSGSALPLRALIEQVTRELKLDVKLEFGSKSLHPFEPHHLVANIERAKRELGWQPSQSLSHAVWELAQESFPTLALHPPPSNP